MTTSHFQSLAQALRDHPNAIPRLIIDRDALDQNLLVLKEQLPAGKQLRIVVKSLPAPSLIRYVMDRMGTQRLMVFHQPFLLDLSRQLGEGVDILFGKPMPVRAAAHYCRTVQAAPGFDPVAQVQWLIDTPERAQEYLQLAQKEGLRIRLNLEIDVGLHRGGFADPDTFRSVLQFIADHPEQLVLSGLMGYDPHVVKLPRGIRSPRRADYVYPPGTKENGLFGSSTNQSMINLPPDITLDVDDYVFLRPHQSEFVFLQFGDLLVYSRKQRRITGTWPLLCQ